LGQIRDLVKLFGVRHLLGMKRRHDKSLPYIRGYAATVVFQTLLNVGFLDALKKEGPVDPGDFARANGLDPDILEYLCEYLDILRILKKSDGGFALDRLGETFMAEPRGTFDLTYGYQPIFSNLEPMLRGEMVFRRDVDRRGDFIAKGSGELGVQLPFPVMREMILAAGIKRVLDLGAGDLEFLFHILEGTDLTAVGIDLNADAVRYARGRLASSRFADRIEVDEADMYDVEALARRWPDVDGVTACDVFHEYLLTEEERIVDLLSRIRAAWPGAAIVVAEFCKQPPEVLRKRPTAFVEHHLFHNLTRQKILSADEWLDIFERAGLGVESQKVFDIVGHGYFVLR
jgi:hypothetical protein